MIVNCCVSNMTPACRLVASVLVLCLGARLASAVTWKLNYTVAAPLSAWYGYPPDNPDCTLPGICKPINTTIPAATLWYWCGWSTKERTEYWVYSSPGPVTVSMMREKDITNCAIPYLSNMKSCYQMTDSVCDTSNNCYNKIYGFSFVDDACIIIANNEKTSAVVSVQVWQYYDSRRYYGTAFAILLLLILISFSVGHMAWTCYNQIKNPTHRIDELEKATRAKLAAVAAAQSAADGEDGATLGRNSALLQGTLHSNSAGNVTDGAASGGGAVAPNASGNGLIGRVKALCGAGPDGNKRGHEH